MSIEAGMHPLFDRLRRIAVLIVAVAALAGSSAGRLGAPARAAPLNVDLALVLAVDCSYSVDAHEFRLQMQGIANAFRQKAIQEAITGNTIGRIAVALVEWSDDEKQVMVIPWQLIDSKAAALGFADIVAATPRKLADGATAIGAALEFSAAALMTAPVAPVRRVIDLSSDGRNNRGIRVTIARDEVVSKGITINALAILNEWPTLNYYFNQQVVGGPYHFTIIANDYAAYAEAIYRKLLKEITGPGMS